MHFMHEFIPAEKIFLLDCSFLFNIINDSFLAILSESIIIVFI